MDAANEVRNCLDLYYKWIGQRINWGKLEIHYIGNVRRADWIRICNLLRMQECSQQGKYLGNSFCRFKSKNKEFNFMAEKMSSKLASKKTKHLSKAGRSMLIQLVLLATPSYIMQVFLLQPMQQDGPYK